MLAFIYPYQNVLLPHIAISIGPPKSAHQLGSTENMTGQCCLGWQLKSTAKIKVAFTSYEEKCMLLCGLLYLTVARSKSVKGQSQKVIETALTSHYSLFSGL